MKKLNILLLSALTALSGSALAMGGSIEQGKNFTNLNLEMGKSSSGLYAESNWLKNTDDGTQTGGVGAGYNLEVGPVMLNAGAKAIYIGPKKGDNGFIRRLVSGRRGDGFDVELGGGKCKDERDRVIMTRVAIENYRLCHSVLHS